MIVFLVCFLCYWVIGIFTLAAVDDNELSLLRWAEKCPLPGGAFWVIMAWPVVVWRRVRGR